MLGCFQPILLLTFIFIVCESVHDENFRKTLYVTPDKELSNTNGKTMIFSADDTEDNGNNHRAKRNTKTDEENSTNIDVKVNREGVFF